jgi:hypothetical protein
MEDPRVASRRPPRKEGGEAYIPIKAATVRTIRNCEVTKFGYMASL